MTDETNHNEATTSSGGSVEGSLARVAGVFEANSYRWVKAFVEAVGFGGWVPLPAHTGLFLIGVYETTPGLTGVAMRLSAAVFGLSFDSAVVAQPG